MILSIFGPDGVGKTTHAGLIANELGKKGYKIKRVWIKNNHMIAFLIITMLKYLSKNNVVTLPSNSILTNILATSNKFSKKLWLWIDFLSVTIKLIISVYIPRFFGYVVIADRYLPDTIVAMILTIMDFSALKSYPIRILLCFLRKDEVTLIMLDRSYELIKYDRDWVEPYSLIRGQKVIYRVLAKLLNAPMISTDNDIAEVHSKIINIIRDY